MKIPMGDNEKYKFDAVYAEKKSASQPKETKCVENEEECCCDSVDNKGERGHSETGLISKIIPKGDEKGFSKSKRNNRASMMRRSLSEVNYFCLIFHLYCERQHY